MMYNHLTDNINEFENESQAPEIIHSEEIKNQQDVAENNKTIDEQIEELPDNFPDANSMLRGDVFPLIVEMDAGLQDYYTVVLQKKFSVGKQTIKESIKAFNQEIVPASIDIDDDEEKEEIDPEIIEKAEQLALEPGIFKKRIGAVNNLGIINEKRNIGMITMTIDSRLNPMGIKGSNVLAVKNTGMQGAGKSATLMSVKELYSKNCYHLIDNGSAKSIYNMKKDALQHKALILNEAFTFQGNSSSDSEFSHIVRCLLSEGYVRYQYTSFDADGNKITKYQTVYGPTPLITTSIYSSLEKQLDDRMFSIHPDISSKQTSDVLSIDAQTAAGINSDIDEKEIQTWCVFHDSLEILDVIIPFAPDIYEFFVQGGELQVSARRAFKRVMISIKTISLLHQKQRKKDDQGRVIAEFSDYALAYQLIDNAFRESLGGGKYTDRRIQLVDKLSPVAPKDLAKVEKVSGAAITSWSKNWLEKGILIWCDDQGAVIKKKDLKKMKHSGKAYLKTVGINKLPTAYELTEDEKWDIDSEFYKFYNLELDVNDDLLRDNSNEDIDLNTYDDSEEVENSGDGDEVETGVKVLDEKAYNEAIKKAKEERMKQVQEDEDFDDPKSLELYEEFSEILVPYVPREDFMMDDLGNNVEPVNNCGKLPDGILTV